ncbi:MAG: hypothetical protein AAFP90_20680, partial [Planctomycetota bacterium]
FVVTGGEHYLVVTTIDDQNSDTVLMKNLITNQKLQNMQRASFLKMGKRKKLVRLLVPPERAGQDLNWGVDDDAETAGVEKENTADAQMATAGDVDGDEDATEDGPRGLDMGAFSQLLSAAQRSQLVSGADQIAYVRDREFRMGQYDLAFQTIEGLFSKFTASARQREQRLKQEDNDIAAGRTQMSQKEIIAKRSKDRRETQEVQRANRRFQTVLEGLRMLMNKGS